MDGLKNIIENILPYYGIGVFIFCIICTISLFLEEVLIRILGECIYLEEVDMIVKRRYTEQVQRNDSDGNLDTNKISYMLELQHPHKPEYKTEISVSQRLYRKSRVGGTVKMHEVIYKYKDKYIKRTVEYSKHNVSKYKKCSQSSKDSFRLFENDILNKCMQYDNNIIYKFQKLFPIIAIPFVSLFIMVFIVSV